jgi:enoyl-CoA hydratase/carnithine racemase
MRESDAAMLVAKLQAAFPHPRVPPETVELYVEELAKLADLEAARGAVADLVHSERFWPSLAALHEAYLTTSRRIREREAAERGLAEPSAEPDPRTREQAWAALEQLKGVEGPFAASIRETLIRLANGQALADELPRHRHLSAVGDDIEAAAEPESDGDGGGRKEDR